MPPVLAIVVVVVAAVWLGTVFFGPPYVPTHRRQLRRLFDELSLGEHDHLVDLGSGDGQVLLECARRGARASGVELNPFLVAIAKWRLRHYTRATVRLGNIWNYRLPEDATYVFVFFAGDFMGRLERFLKHRKMHRPVKLISYGFELEGYRPSKTIGAFYIYEF